MYWTKLESNKFDILTSRRETFQFGILYFIKGQDEVQMLENQGGSKDYQKFVSSVGWIVQLSEHNGFAGGLDPKVTGSLTPYFANYSNS